MLRPLLLADLPPRSVRDGVGRVLLTPCDLDHAGYVRLAFDQVRLHSAPFPLAQQALVRTLRMLKEAISPVEDRDRPRAELDRQLDLALTDSARPGVLPGDGGWFEAARE